ncbi:MAG: hypothetical protein AAFX02_09005 [Pseudomonadota bacterium]
MRDDIHKKVPRPRKTQEWVKHALREADRVAGRSLKSLEASLDDACERELSPGFRLGVDRLLNGLPNLYGEFEEIESPRAIGGIGGPLEDEYLNEAQRAFKAGAPLEEALQEGLAKALRNRTEGDIRATEPVLAGSDDPDAKQGIEQMKRDAQHVDYSQAAKRSLNGEGSNSDKRNSDHVSPDENLLGPTNKLDNPK